MTMPRTSLGLLAAAIAVLCSPGVASAEYLVPPSNSAATQYTEALPTAGGNRDTDRGGQRDRTPDQVLGQANARRLEEHGSSGEEVAEFAAETAPETPAEDPPRPDPDQGGADRGPDAQGQQHDADEDEDETGGGGAGGTGGTAAPDPSGSSGLGEVLTQATGLSSGALSPLLLLTLVGAAIWAFAFLRSQRNRTIPR
jgi:hypothetical protein